jgi:polar amino acid transport system permease protein
MQTLRLVILPQALLPMLPPLTGQAVSLIKDSALVGVIAIYDLTSEARTIIADTLMTFEVWLTVAAIYLALGLLVSAFAGGLERRLRRRGAEPAPRTAPFQPRRRGMSNQGDGVCTS